MIEYYRSSTYRSFGGRIEDIDWNEPFKDYRKAAKRPDYFIPEDGLSVYVVLDKKYVFYCEPYATCIQNNKTHPCNIKCYNTIDNGLTHVTYVVYWKDFIKNPYFFTKYASLALDKIPKKWYDIDAPRESRKEE